jgi:hypothetical protein
VLKDLEQKVAVTGELSIITHIAQLAAGNWNLSKETKSERLAFPTCFSIIEFSGTFVFRTWHSYAWRDARYHIPRRGVYSLTFTILAQLNIHVDNGSR